MPDSLTILKPSRCPVTSRFRYVSRGYDRVLLALIATLEDESWLPFEVIVRRTEASLSGGKPTRETGSILRIRIYEKLVALLERRFVERENNRYRAVPEQLPPLAEYVASCRADSALRSRVLGCQAA